MPDIFLWPSYQGANDGLDDTRLYPQVQQVDSGTYAIIGSPSVRAFDLTATSGVYTLSGSTVALQGANTLTATGGVYTLTGTTAGLRATRLLSPITSGTYALTGTAVGLRATRLLSPITSGVYTLSGTDATLTFAGGGVAQTPLTLALMGYGR